MNRRLKRNIDLHGVSQGTGVPFSGPLGPLWLLFVALSCKRVFSSTSREWPGMLGAECERFSVAVESWDLMNSFWSLISSLLADPASPGRVLRGARAGEGTGEQTGAPPPPTPGGSLHLFAWKCSLVSLLLSSLIFKDSGVCSRQGSVCL